MKRFQQSAIGIIVAGFVLACLLAKTLVRLLTDTGWFEATVADVFWTRIGWQNGIWVATFGVYALFLYQQLTLWSQEGSRVIAVSGD